MGVPCLTENSMGMVLVKLPKKRKGIDSLVEGEQLRPPE